MTHNFVFRSLREFADDKRGTTAVMFGLMAVPLFAMIGLATDIARASAQKARIQTALDTAVIGARNEPPATKISVANAYFNSNMDGAAAPATANFSLTSDGQLKGDVISEVQTPFAAIININSFTVSAKAAAKPDKEITTGTPGGIPCIHVMDQSGAKTFWLDSNSNLNASTCEVHVRSNHSSQAMYEVSSSNVTFKKVLVKGSATLDGSKLKIADAPFTVTQDADVVSNPYMAAIGDVVQQIAPGACTADNTNKVWSGTVNPGTYCGSTEFKNATFNTGLYIIASGNGAGKDGALKLTGSINGSAGVSFFFADNKSKLASYAASENSTLKAPTSGLTRGLLFFEPSNRGAGYAFTLKSVNKQSWTGLVYLPSVNVTLESLSEWGNFNVALAVNQLKMKSLSSVMLPYQWTPWNQTNPVALPGDEVTTTVPGYLTE